MREREVERLLYREVKTAGGMCIKIAPTVAGVPDRLVVLPGSRFYLVELKAPGGRLRPIQRVFHDRLRALGADAVVLSSTDEVREWLGGLTNSQDA